jgi:ABC-2 type transport system permease protein
MKFDSTGKEFRPYALGYMYQGPLKSAFVPAPAVSVSSPDKQPLAESQKPVRLVVVGSSAFTSDEWLRYANHPLFSGYQNGPQLLYNAIGWTLEDEALIPLRSKTMDSRQIPPTSETTATVIQWLNILGLPVVFCLFGVIYWLIRRSKRATQTL